MLDETTAQAPLHCWHPYLHLVLVTLLFLVQKFEKYVVDPDAESDFSCSNINPCPDVSQEGSSKNEI